MKLCPPTSVDATSCGNTLEVHPLSAIVTYQFPARGDLPPLKLTWYEGTRPPRPPELEDGRKMPAEGGVLYKGSKGTIMAGVYGDSPRIIPEARMQEAKLPDKTLPRVPDSHELDWVRACKSGEPAGADFSYSGPLAEICCLGNIAKRVDARIEWDAANLRVTNLPDANAFVRREYRQGWEVVRRRMNPKLGNLFSRRSIRAYRPGDVDAGLVRDLLEAAMAAPSAVAKDPWDFVVVRDRATLSRIAAGLPNGGMLATAAVGIVVCGDLRRAHDGQLSYLLQDCSAAIENLLLAASALGLGTCWLGVHPREERIAHIRSILKVPHPVIPVAAVAIGWPDETKEPRTRYREQSVHYETF